MFFCRTCLVFNSENSSMGSSINDVTNFPWFFYPYLLRAMASLFYTKNVFKRVQILPFIHIHAGISVTPCNTCHILPISLALVTLAKVANLRQTIFKSHVSNLRSRQTILLTYAPYPNKSIKGLFFRLMCHQFLPPPP